jgi:superfamily I DNA/RNA helicase
LSRWKSTLAGGALEFAAENRIPTYDALFVDEAQDLMPEEVALLKAWSPNLFFVGDDRQKIYSHSEGLNAVRTLSPVPIERFLPFHYRMAPEICEMADRIQVAEGGRALSATSHYKGPQPGRIRVHGPLTRHEQIERAGEALHDQLRVYAGLIEQGDRLAVVVPRQDDRDLVLDTLEENASLVGKSKIIRARSGEVEDREYDPSFNRDQPIAILTEQGSKGLEFRAVHWLFCDEAHWRKAETYYTVVTRAKTRLDIYHGSDLPGMLAKAYSPPAGDLW